MEADGHFLALEVGDDGRRGFVGERLEGEVRKDLEGGGGGGKEHLGGDDGQKRMREKERVGKDRENKGGGGQAEKEVREGRRIGTRRTGARMKIPLKGGSGSFSPSCDDEEEELEEIDEG